jgi:hypothetical protein
MAQLLFVARDSLLPCTAYTANCPCGKRLIVALHNVHGQYPCVERLIIAPSPVAILGKEFVIAVFGKRLIVALLDKCGLLGVLAVLSLSNVHAVFSELTVLSFGNVHTFGGVHVGTELRKFPLPVIDMPVRVWGSVRVLAHALTSTGHHI